MDEFRTKLTSLLNCESKENESDTPDFILANYLIDCLRAFDDATIRREMWYGRNEPLAPLTTESPKGPEK